MFGSREVRSEAAHIDAAGAAIDTAGEEEHIAAAAAAGVLALRLRREEAGRSVAAGQTW